MKKLLATLLVAGAIAMTACKPNMYGATASESKLKSNGYTVEVYTDAEARARITAINFEGITIANALIANKGTGDNADMLLAFYFNSVADCDLFHSRNNYENHAAMDNYATRELGSNLAKKVGTMNNVCYCGSETSYAAAF